MHYEPRRYRHPRTRKYLIPPDTLVVATENGNKFHFFDEPTCGYAKYGYYVYTYEEVLAYDLTPCKCCFSKRNYPSYGKDFQRDKKRLLIRQKLTRKTKL